MKSSVAPQLRVSFFENPLRVRLINVILLDRFIVLGWLHLRLLKHVFIIMVLRPICHSLILAPPLLNFYRAPILSDEDHLVIERVLHRRRVVDKRCLQVRIDVSQMYFRISQSWVLQRRELFKRVLDRERHILLFLVVPCVLRHWFIFKFEVPGSKPHNWPQLLPFILWILLQGLLWMGLIDIQVLHGAWILN